MVDRGVSTVVSYVLALGIVALLAVALIGAFGSFVTDQQQDATRSTLRVYGNDLAADIGGADRLAQEAGTNGTVVVRTRLPEQVGESPYEIAIEQVDGNRYEITLRTRDVDASVFVGVRTSIPLRERTGDAALDGGDLRIVYEPGPELVIENV